MRSFLLLLICALAVPWDLQAGQDTWGMLPVQHGGRVKPLDTLARESLLLIYGRDSFKGTKASKVVATWWLAPQEWLKTPLFYVPRASLKKALTLDLAQDRFSFVDLVQNEQAVFLIKNLRSNTDDAAFLELVKRLEQQLAVFLAWQSGDILSIQSPNGTWQKLNQLPQDQIKSFALFAQNSLDLKNAQKLKNLSHKEAHNILPWLNPPATTKRVQVEYYYNFAKPFLWACVGLLLCMLLAVFNLRAAWWVGGISLGVVVLGLATRSYILQRAPITNMYETVLWVALVGALGSAMLSLIYKKLWVLGAGAALAAMCLWVSEQAHTVLDSSLQPLEPVLRDNFWLLTHVLIITCSYGAFFLALVLGDVLLVRHAWQGFKKPHAKNLAAFKSTVALMVYRCIQVGVVLLTVGIILGGLWADVSWGRFWGWDPKETWALIALIAYLVWLHARIGGWLKGVPLIAAQVLAFNCVIMAWYGVNFVLGAGLHSYGFGSGGIEYVAAFVVAHLVLVAFASSTRTVP